MEPDVQSKTGTRLNRKGRLPGAKIATTKELKTILQLKLLNYSYQEIADRLGRPLRFVYHEIAKHEKEIRERLENNVIAERIRQVEALNFVVEESARSFLVSKGEDPDLATIKAPGVTPGHLQRAPVLRPGDVAFLREIRGALSDQREVFNIGKASTETNINLSQATVLAEQLVEQHGLEALEVQGDGPELTDDSTEAHE